MVIRVGIKFESSEEHKGLIAANALVPVNLESLQPKHVSLIKAYCGKILKKGECLDVEIEK